MRSPLWRTLAALACAAPLLTLAACGGDDAGTGLDESGATTGDDATTLEPMTDPMGGGVDTMGGTLMDTTGMGTGTGTGAGTGGTGTGGIGTGGAGTGTGTEGTGGGQ